MPRKPPQRSRLSDIALSEISLVDRPANPGARLALFKRDDSVTQTAAAIEAVSKDAKSFNEIWLATDIEEEWWKLSSALRNSISSILTDDGVTDKKAAITASIDQFKTAVVGEINDVAKGDHPMTTKTETTETVTKADHDKVVAQVAALTEKLAKAETDKAVAQLPADQRSHYDGLADTAKAEFLAKSETDRAAIVKAATALPDHVAKALDDIRKENAELRARVEKEEAAKADTKALEIAKSILGEQGGDPKELAAVVKGLDEAGIETLRKSFDAQRTFAKFAGGSDPFKPVGKTATAPQDEGVAKATFQGKVDELRKSDPKLTAEQAQARVLETNPELYDALS